MCIFDERLILKVNLKKVILSLHLVLVAGLVMLRIHYKSGTGIYITEALFN